MSPATQHLATHPIRHTPVMLGEVMAALAPRDGEVFIDGTFGAGGYSRALLEAADCTVWAIDRDPEAVSRGRELAARSGGRLTVVAGRYGDMLELLRQHGVISVDGIALDIGVSSTQLDDAGRGFSFSADGPLDMRMGAGDAISGPSAYDAVNTLSEADLADTIYRYGDERKSRRIAKAIIRARTRAPIERTLELADIVRGAARGTGATGRRGIDPATRTFQALRIYVNDELGELDRALRAAEHILRPGGRLAVVAFHSLEDRRVKSFLKTRCGPSARPSRHLPSLSSRGTSRGAAPPFRLLNRRVIKPSATEVKHNPRSRSARMRAAVRTEAPPMAVDQATDSRPSPTAHDGDNP
ncbi:MAG: 16S rRNA (cytosine(1402)-N(4))-methyltransferase RsmH [Alphaproteobacteria bacterium]